MVQQKKQKHGMNLFLPADNSDNSCYIRRKLLKEEEEEEESMNK